MTRARPGAPVPGRVHEHAAGKPHRRGTADLEHEAALARKTRSSGAWNAVTAPNSSASSCSACMKAKASITPVDGDRSALVQASAGSSTRAAAPSSGSRSSTHFRAPARRWRRAACPRRRTWRRRACRPGDAARRASRRRHKARRGRRRRGAPSGCLAGGRARRGSPRCRAPTCRRRARGKPPAPAPGAPPAPAPGNANRQPDDTARTTHST